MAKHKKFDLLMAKGENMDLVLMLKYKSMGTWELSPNSYPPNNDNCNAFLCLPKHKNACLKALNGQTISVKTPDGLWIESGIIQAWMPDGWYMSDVFESSAQNLGI